MKKVSVETSVGVFVFIGLICVAYMAIKLGKMEWFGDDYYFLNARFTSISGLKTGAQVDLAGVDVGQVTDIWLDNKRQMAAVRMKIKKEVTLTDDVIASVKTSGLIGDKYISLTPGGSDRVLKSGDMIIETEPPLDIEALVSKYVFGSAGK
ncbi:Mammalian cell entry related domain protein [Desulfosarcina cetonica]|uniref:outer membrane lipid asymmetry maintenance protein MlaD n=1 Tax=Desulfosarcina cetonica TaxID=90730 RepID=UPI0006D01BBB|nr:outer membrane lipid asymmetry maintenance protein MlaD [Desulfosarcina cetonica]VTR68936.1 Mammalian cell entry related domain protein [Desulfosarcina cetonica]